MPWENNNEVIIPRGWLKFNNAVVTKTQDLRKNYPYNKTLYEITYSGVGGGGGGFIPFLENGGIGAAFQYLRISDATATQSNISPFILPFATTLSAVTFTNGNVGVTVAFNVRVNGVIVYNNTLSTGPLTNTFVVLPTPIAIAAGGRVSVEARRIGANHSDPIITLMFQ